MLLDHLFMQEVNDDDDGDDDGYETLMNCYHDKLDYIIHDDKYW